VLANPVGIEMGDDFALALVKGHWGRGTVWGETDVATFAVDGGGDVGRIGGFWGRAG